MAASNAKATFGTALIRSTYMVAELTEIGGISTETAMIAATIHDSPDGYTAYKPGLLKGGTITIAGYLYASDTNGQIGLHTDLEAGTKQSFIIAAPNAMALAWSFSAYVKSLSIGSPKDGLVSFGATLQIAGKPTWISTASTGATTPFISVADNSANAIALTPTVANDVYYYSGTAITTATSITVTPTATAGVIHVNGTVVSTGEASGAISLGDAGTTTFVTVRVTETSKTPVIYRLYILRAEP